MINFLFRSLVVSFALLTPCFAQERGLFVGGGAFAGEMTDTTAKVLVRLTATGNQLADATIPGREGEARLRYGAEAGLANAKMTNWKTALPEINWSVKFELTGLPQAARQFYRVEMRVNAGAPITQSDVRSFMNAPPSHKRVRYDPADRSLACEFYSMTGEPLFEKVFTP